MLSGGGACAGVDIVVIDFAGVTGRVPRDSVSSARAAAAGTG